jgi:hypothetical protein
MNSWSRKTLNLIKNGRYLDELQVIYPQEDAIRDVSKDSIKIIKQLYSSGKKKELLEYLLDLEKFPYKDSYAGFLRKSRSSITKNPTTAKRIYKNLFDMGVSGLLTGIAQSKEANTRRGSQFRKWMKNEFKSLSVGDFEKSKRGIVVLNANEKDALDFCNLKLKMGITKRPDIVCKKGSIYVVGEAKFLSSTGGNQGRAFDDGMQLASNSAGIARKVFILDGIHWIEVGSDQFKRINSSSFPILSALLLKSYLNSLK